MLAALVCAAVAIPVPAPVFAPPLDTPIRYTIRETRTNGRAPQVYTMTRSVVFRRDGDGFTAEVKTTAVEAQPANGRADLFVAIGQGFLGRVLRVRLDRHGRVTDVVDRQREWDGWLDRMTAAMKRTDARAYAGVEKYVTALRPTAPDEQLRTLGAYVARIVGSAIVARAPLAKSPIRLPAARPGAATELAGTETIVTQPDGMVRYERVAQGTLGNGGTTRTSLVQTIQPRTGLIVQTRETTAFALAGRTLTTERITTLFP